MISASKWLTTLSVSAVLSFSSFSIFAAETVAEDYSAIKERLSTMVENASEAVISKTPIEGLYQIQVGMAVAYMSKDGEFLLSGNLVELDTRENWTERAKSATRKIMMADVPVDSMIIFPAKGKEKHFMTVFSDIDCGYCIKLHKEVPALNKAGITVRYLSYPRAGFGSPSYDKAVAVWCAKDRRAAMNKAKKGEKVKAESCVNPVKDHLVLARRFDVSGTPTIVLDNGEMLPGYVPAKEIIKIFNQ